MPWHSFYNFTFWNRICLFLAALGLCRCTRTFSSCGERERLSSWGGQTSHSWGFSFCGTRLGYLGTVDSEHMGLVAPRHVESSQTRDWTCVPWIGRWILNYWTTREVQTMAFWCESLGSGLSIDRVLLIVASNLPLIPQFSFTGRWIAQLKHQPGLWVPRLNWQPVIICFSGMSF